MATPVVGLVLTPAILLVTLRRKRLRPWLPTYAMLSTADPGSCCSIEKVWEIRPRRNRGADAIALRGLQLVFSLSRPVEQASTDPKDRLIVQSRGGPTQTQPGTEIRLLHVEPGLARVTESSGRHVEKDGVVVDFMEDRVVLIP